MSDTDQRHLERARHVPELVAILTALVDEVDPTAPAVIAARRLLDEMGGDRDGRQFSSLTSALRGCIALGGDGQGIERARAWMRSHCSGCGIAVARGFACPACRSAWKRTSDPSRVA
jgi:hypothetical protein